MTLKLPELGEWPESPLYDPVIMWLPVTAGVYVTLHVAIAGPLPAARVQVDEGLKIPVEFVVKLTVPVGVLGLLEVSMTLAVQVVGVFTTTEPIEQLTFVCVA